MIDRCICTDNEIIQILTLYIIEIRCSVLEKDVTRCKESHKESEILLGALNALQDKTAHLEDSLSAETRIKLDLFSALGEAKRQVEIRDSK